MVGGRVEKRSLVCIIFHSTQVVSCEHLFAFIGYTFFIIHYDEIGSRGAMLINSG